MRKFNGYIVDSDHVIVEGQSYVRLFGRLENGKSFVTINKISPYFFFKSSDKKNVSELIRDLEVEKTELRTFNEVEVLKVSFANIDHLNSVLKNFNLEGVPTFEADIKPNMRFIIDNDLLGSIEISGEIEKLERVDCFFKEPKIVKSSFKPQLKILSCDIESGSKGELFCIGLYGEDYERTFLVTEKKIEGCVICKDEEECLIKFKEEIINFDPDIITGWNFIDFDLVFLQEKFRKYKIDFDIGRTSENLRLRIEENFLKASSAKVSGRQVVDGLSFIKDPFIQEAPSIKNLDFESYTLENVAQQILGEGKLLKGKGRHIEIEELFYSSDKRDVKKLIDYNLLDCKLVFDILEKTKMIDLAIERSQLTGMTLDKITASILAFDSLYIREARKKSLVSPTNSFGIKENKIKGGYVFASKSGIFHNVLVLDFKSLYPSIIRTFNIDPASFLLKREQNSIESPNHAFFKNNEGILPAILDKLHFEREKAKKEKRELSSYAIKIIMNSFFGVLASPNSRYFNFDMANAITNFGQMLIQLTAKKIAEKGFKITYSDTDSVFVETNLSPEKANLAGYELANFINDFYKKYVNENYNRISYLEIDFKKQYLSLMIPNVRNSTEDEEKVAKKRYAGLIYGEKEIEIVGLEAIRGDWTEAAGDFQRQLLMKIFNKEPIENFIREYVKKIISGQLDKLLLYRKSIRKNLEEYTKTTPPHVKAARKLDKIESNIIEYYITVDGPEPIQKLKHKLDYEHYIDKQIKPIADQVLSLLDKNFDDIILGSRQKKLF